MSRTADRQISFADLELTLQGIADGAASASDLRFSGRPRRDDRPGPTRFGTRLEEPRDWSRRIDTATSSALAGSHARQELALSGAARTDRRRNHAAPVHGLLLSAGASTRCIQPRLQSTDAGDAQGHQ